MSIIGYNSLLLPYIKSLMLNRSHNLQVITFNFKQ
jgi:hypothetical protein